MRIAYIAADRGVPVFGSKGASIHIQEMIRAYARLGHDVRCLAARRGEAGDLPVEEIAQASHGQDRAAKERAAMAQADAIAARLAEMHAERPFDLIYERYSLWSAAGVRAARRLGVPVVMEINAPLLEEQRAFRNLVCEAEAGAIEREVLQGASAFAAVSGQVADWLVEKGAPAARVHVVGNAVDTRRFHPSVAPAPVVPEGAFCVGFTGSLKMWHGVDTLLRAFMAFRACHPAAHLLIVGDGPKRGWIEGFAAGAGLDGAVTMTGWVEHADLPPLIARMDVATAPYPAAEAHYFSPLKLFEYLAMGRPVLASDIGQTAELLKGRDAALLTPPGDADALAKALARLATDPELRGRMARSSAVEGARRDWIENARRIVTLGELSRRAA